MSGESAKFAREARENDRISSREKNKNLLIKKVNRLLAFASYVRREGHLYEVFLVLAKTRLI